MQKNIKPNPKNKIAPKIPKPRSSKRLARLRGMRDILADEYKYWNLAIKKAQELELDDATAELQKINGEESARVARETVNLNEAITI